MNLEVVSESVEWLEHKTRPLFVLVALILYAISLVQLGIEVNPLTELGTYLIGALANLSIPFGVILLQELLELVAMIPESNLLSARHQFEIVVLVLVRSFFKNFAKVSGYVADGELGVPVQESIAKIFAIIIMVVLIFIFRKLAGSQILETYASGQTINPYKQLLVIGLIVLALFNMLFVNGIFDELEFIQLVFTGIIIIDAVFLILAILRSSLFLTLIFESALIIALIFARFPLFVTNLLSVVLSVIGVAFAVAALFVMVRVLEAGVDTEALQPQTKGHH